MFKRGYFATLYSFAMVLHEVAHYVVAKKLRYRCTEIQIGIFGAVLYGDFGDVAGLDRIKIAAAGPACNLVLCLFCLAAWWVLPEFYYFTDEFFAANLSMAAVNVLPCYPLDGGRILTGILERKRINALKTTKIITVVLSLAAFLLFVFSLYTPNKLFSVGLFAIGLFAGVFAQSGGCYVRAPFVQNRNLLRKRGMEKKTLVFNENCPLSDVVRRMQGNYAFCLEVVDEHLALKKRYNYAELEKAIMQNNPDTPLGGLKI